MVQSKSVAGFAATLRAVRVCDPPGFAPSESCAGGWDGESLARAIFLPKSLLSLEIMLARQVFYLNDYTD